MKSKKLIALSVLLISLSFDSFSQIIVSPPTLFGAPISCENKASFPWRQSGPMQNFISVCSQYERVGIGTSQPQKTLHVKGTTKLQGETEITGYTNILNSMYLQNHLTTDGNINIRNSGRMQIGCNDVAAANLSGNQSLLVDGTIICEELKVQLSSNWADYVFANDYYLKPLDIVETFIKQNKHLPGVPSAQEIENDGITVGEMLKIQMEKIEELTLYIVDQNKRISQLESQIK